METPSLLHHFDAPDNFHGCFGFFCGYSADLAFLDQAAERFTRQNTAQRAYSGLISMALMLNPGHPHLNLTDIPGIAHLHFDRNKNKRFSLMHAKVAVLGFKGVDDPSQWVVRLVVSTGNWTVQTVEESLDLFVSIDCSNKTEQSLTENIQNCADITAAWQMLRWLMELYDSRILFASVKDQKSKTVESMELVQSWLLKINRVAKKTTPRFFCSIKDSLLNQLVNQIKHHAGETRRNYIAMGSGFFEGGTASNQVPSVLKKIETTLKHATLLTKESPIEIFVNPDTCRIIALNLDAMIQDGYTIRAANTPPDIFGQQSKRSLHAKFIFSANKTSSPRCNSPWIYLGSGNLTGPGFINAMSANGGNLEAGMLIVPDQLYWDKHPDSNKWIENFLPIHSKANSDITSIDAPQEGDDMEMMNEETALPLLALLHWKSSNSNNGGFLFTNEPTTDERTSQELTVLDVDEQPCVLSDDNQWIWQGNMPRSVKISWGDPHSRATAYIPVMDEFGRLAATELQPLNIDDAMLHLMNFPYSGIDDDPIDDPEGEVISQDSTSPSTTHVNETDASYPIRKMMALLEQIAKQQVGMHPLNWDFWCTRLEQTLLQMNDSPIIAEFIRLKINPVTCLIQPSFRPDFSLDSTSGMTTRYEGLIHRIAEKWCVSELNSFGESV